MTSVFVILFFAQIIKSIFIINNLLSGDFIHALIYSTISPDVSVLLQHKLWNIQWIKHESSVLLWRDTEKTNSFLSFVFLSVWDFLPPTQGEEKGGFSIETPLCWLHQRQVVEGDLVCCDVAHMSQDYLHRCLQPGGSRAGLDLLSSPISYTCEQTGKPETVEGKVWNRREVL